METSKIFGDRDFFAIRYKFNEEGLTIEAKDKLAYCHLMINDKLLGYHDEVCYLPTWLYSLTDQRNRIADTKEWLFPKEFEALTDREIFEIILKANQFEEEFNPEFLYLPQLDNGIWSRHSFTLDETIDSYLIYFYVKDDKITFLIEDETDSSDSNHRSYNFGYHTIPLNLFFETISETTAFLTHHYPYLKDNVSRRTFNSS